MTRPHHTIAFAALAVAACALLAAPTADASWDADPKRLKVPEPMTDIVLAPDRNFWTISQSGGALPLGPRGGAPVTPSSVTTLASQNGKTFKRWRCVPWPSALTVLQLVMNGSST